MGELMTNVLNRRETFYNLIKNALVGTGNNRYATDSLVVIYDDIQQKATEIYIELDEDNLLTRSENEGYGMLFEEREQLFTVLLRKRIKIKNDVVTEARNTVNVELEKMQRCLLQNITFESYQIVVSNNIWNKFDVTDVQILTTASMLGEATDVIVMGKILYTFSN